MEKISKKQLDEMTSEGSTILRQSLHGKGEASELSKMVAALDRSATARLEQLSRSTEQHVNAVSKSAEVQLRALLQLMQQQDSGQTELIARLTDILTKQKIKTAYRFVIKRDTKGIMQSVDAHPIGDK